MKDFFKYFLATITALIVIGLIVFASFLGAIGSVMSSSKTTDEIGENSVLKLNLSGTMSEREQSNPLNKILNDGTEIPSLENWRTAIDIASTNDDIKGIFMKAGAFSVDMASAQELRNCLLNFKKKGKFIIAYADTYTQGAYYLCSVADKIILNPSGMLDWHGLASQPMFYTEVLKKVGIKVQVFRVGTYKSFVEPYTRIDMSPANREQIKVLTSGLWNSMVNDVALSRKKSPEYINGLADQYITLSEATNFVKYGLVDTLAYSDGVKELLKKECNCSDKLKIITPSKLIASVKKNAKDNQVAVFYAYGDIVDKTPESFQQTACISTDKVVPALEKLAKNEKVKAVVLRVNSGGGSAYASEQIWHAVKQLNAKKPVIVSMGGMAASGGYYISSASRYIFADPMTITGSIGIFGMVPDLSELLTNKIGLHFDVVKTNKSSDFGSISRPFNEEEATAMQNYVNSGYQQFLTRVGAGRNMKTEDVNKIAQGRVWSGKQALKIGLVDKLGSLENAIAYAAETVKLKDYSVSAFPAKKEWFEELLNKTKKDYLEESMNTKLGKYFAPLMYMMNMDKQDYLQTRMPYELNFNN